LAKCILRYLYTTKDWELKLGGEVLVLREYSDADFAGDTEDHKSTGGYVIYLGEGAIAWSSWKQPTLHCYLWSLST
jgi:hypothetical protein